MDRIQFTQVLDYIARMVTRVEVIDETGRVYTVRPCTVTLSLQDTDRTLKVFVEKGEQ